TSDVFTGNRPPRQSMPNRTPSPALPPLPSVAQPPSYPQSAPSIFNQTPRMISLTTVQPPAPQQFMAAPPSQQTDLPAPLITVVMHPSYGAYSVPISSYPFGILPLQMAQGSAFNTLAPAPSMLPSIEAMPSPSNAALPYNGDSRSGPIIPFISNGARQSAPTNKPEPLPKVKTSDINANGIVSVLQEVFHIPPSAISIDGKPIALIDAAGKKVKGSAGAGKGDSHGEDDNPEDSDNDSDAQESADVDLDSRYNVGEIARSRRIIRSKLRTLGRGAKTLSKKESKGDDHDDSKSSSVNDDSSSGDSAEQSDQIATSTSASPADSADNASKLSTSMNLASHGAALLSVAMPKTTMAASLKIERADDSDDDGDDVTKVTLTEDN
ncbi:hypothetical protein IWW38_004751, partial [Coemansia aciculifera]